MLRWYALQIQPRLASVASAALSAKGYEEYFPRYRSRRCWSDRVKEQEVPLFPGYVFCRFDPQDRLVPVLTTPGVLAIVGHGRTPCSIADEEIEAIKTLLACGLAVNPYPYVDLGARVLVEHGPLAGIEGIVVSTEKVHRLVVSITLLQRSVAVEIDRAWVRPCSPFQRR